MRCLIVGDLHLTEKQPDSRMDNFEETVIQKFEFILRTAYNEECEMILSPGDFTDSPTASWRFFNRIVLAQNLYNIPIYTVYGQHDLKYRNKGNTFLDALSYSCKSFEILYSGDYLIKNEASICGASYNEEIPDPFSGEFKILLIHKMIVEDKLWAAQEDYEYSAHFLRKHKFDLIVSGDNHKSFMATSGNRFLFNCGSMTRMRADQIDHQPICIVFDTKDRSYKEIPIPIEKDVFKSKEFEKELNVELTSFIEGLKEQEEVGLDFVNDLDSYCKANNISEEITNEIDEAMHG